MSEKLTFDLQPWENTPSTKTPISAENLNSRDELLKKIVNKSNEISELVDKKSQDIANLKQDVDNLKEGGADGEDGFSPVATVKETESGVIISIQDKNGTTTATVKNGAKGDTPVKGVDYFTTADKNEMVNLVINSLPIWTGGSY